MVFYRGLHCPLCKKYLQQLQELLPAFKERAVQVVALSMDTEEGARLARQKWELPQVPIGYALPEAIARTWGLFLSAGVKDGEPTAFSEPDLFLIDGHNKV